MVKMEMEKVARWAFTAFVIIAIVMGLVVGIMANSVGNEITWRSDSNVKNANTYVTLILLILGIVVGLISITAKEVTPFLIAAIALIVASLSNVWSPLQNGTLDLLYYWATEILSFIVAFTAPAAVIIAIKSVFAMERTK
ncbi:MAG TPA: hypothetical protein VMT42_01860 [candidate division Zixibacteria bacterium]|nr:hypothetical protein [candidate division Zixibacteria bacterium]